MGNSGRKMLWSLQPIGLAAAGVIATATLAAGQSAPQGQVIRVMAHDDGLSSTEHVTVTVTP